MVESAEGIGGRKWSLLREDGAMYLMEGKTRLANLTPEGVTVLHLLVSAPQLWAAANDVLKKIYGVGPSQLEDAGLSLEDVQRLGNAVAKAVNKTDYTAVRQ